MQKWKILYYFYGLLGVLSPLICWTFSVLDMGGRPIIISRGFVAALFLALTIATFHEFKRSTWTIFHYFMVILSLADIPYLSVTMTQYESVPTVVHHRMPLFLTLEGINMVRMIAGLTLLVHLRRVRALGEARIKENRKTYTKLKKTVILSLVLIFNFMVLTGLFYIKYSECEEINSLVLQEMLHNKEDILMIDIRSRQAFDQGHIHGSISVPVASGMYDKIKRHSNYKDKPVIVVCTVGTGSIIIGTRLNMMGFKKVYSLKGGIEGWQKMKGELSF